MSPFTPTIVSKRSSVPGADDVEVSGLVASRTRSLPGNEFLGSGAAVSRAYSCFHRNSVFASVQLPHGRKVLAPGAYAVCNLPDQYSKFTLALSVDVKRSKCKDAKKSTTLVDRGLCIRSGCAAYPTYGDVLVAYLLSCADRGREICTWIRDGVTVEFG